MKKNKKETLHTKLHKEFDPGMKRMDFHDLGFTKLAVIAGVLFLITAWPGLFYLVVQVHWSWYFLAMILLSIRPMKHFFNCRKK